MTKKKVTEEKKPETKAVKFQRLALKRVGKTLHDITLVGNLSGSGYEYTPEQVNKIFSAFNLKLKDVYEKFQPKKKTEEVKKSEFTF